MKAKPTIHRMKRVPGKLLILGTFACVGLFAAGCGKDNCGKSCKTMGNFIYAFNFGAFNNYIPCSHDYNLAPGDSFTFDVPDLPQYTYADVVGCSSSPWTLTATPDAGITVRIYRGRPQNNCLGRELIGESSAPGDAVSITGSAGCMVSSTDVINIRASGAVGSIMVTFN